MDADGFFYCVGGRTAFGIRSCDLSGIWHLDRFYLGREFRDLYYARRRENLFLVNVVCTDPERDIGEECFCPCADTGPAAREHFDLQLMDLRGEFMAVAGTPAGEAFFAQPMFRPATPAHVEKRRAILGEVRKRFKTTTSWFPASRIALNPASFEAFLSWARVPLAKMTSRIEAVMGITS